MGQGNGTPIAPRADPAVEAPVPFVRVTGIRYIPPADGSPPPYFINSGNSSPNAGPVLRIQDAQSMPSSVETSTPGIPVKTTGPQLTSPPSTVSNGTSIAPRVDTAVEAPVPFARVTGIRYIPPADGSPPPDFINSGKTSPNAGPVFRILDAQSMPSSVETSTPGIPVKTTGPQLTSPPSTVSSGSSGRAADLMALPLPALSRTTPTKTTVVQTPQEKEPTVKLPSPVVIQAPLLPADVPAMVPPSATAPAPVTPDRWLLMKALQGTWEGDTLVGNHMQIYGWTESSYTGQAFASRLLADRDSESNRRIPLEPELAHP